MARTIRISLKRFLFQNKVTVLVIVLIVTLILFLPQRSDSQGYIENMAKTFHEPPPYSKAELEAYYKFELGLSVPNKSNNVECENVWMMAAIPGRGIEDFVWEYMSLLAINELYGESEGRKINLFLAKSSIMELERIFERTIFTDLGTVPDRCYRLHEAILVENGNKIYFNANAQVKSLFLLGEGERRYKEIAETYGGSIYRQYFKLNERFKQMASSEIANYKTQLEIMVEVPIIGMYIRTLQLPSTYYERAMDFQRKIHYESIFLVFCPSHLLNDCRDNFSSEDTVIVEQRSLELELAILAMCDHTVIENELGILGALINDKMGDTVIYDRMPQEIEWVSKYMTENFENWYPIA